MMLVDCQTCPVRDVHCADCMVTALTAIPIVTRSERRQDAWSDAPDIAEPDSVPLDRAERRAVSVLLAAGLVSHTAANEVRAVRETGRVGSHAPVSRRRAAG